MTTTQQPQESDYLRKLRGIQEEYNIKDLYPRAQQEVIELLSQRPDRATFYVCKDKSLAAREYVTTCFREDGLDAEVFITVHDCYDKNTIHKDCVRVIIPRSLMTKK